MCYWFVGGSLFHYSCQVVNARTRKCFRASLFALAEEFIAFTRSGSNDGISCAGKNIALSLVFEQKEQLYKFQSALLNRVSFITGSKRPAPDTLPTVIGINEVIVADQSVSTIAIVGALTRVMKYSYERQIKVDAGEDSGSDDSDDDDNEDTDDLTEEYDSPPCDLIGDSASIFSCECVNISDAETRVQMLENHYHAHFVGKNPEVAHIKDQAKCKSTAEINDVNNHLFLSRFLHEHFDGINMILEHTPSFKIHYVGHASDCVDCPIGEGSLLQVPHIKRHRSTIRISFFNHEMRTTLLTYFKDGYTAVGNDIEMELFFQNGAVAKKYFDWKEKRTQKKWDSHNLNEI